MPSYSIIVFLFSLSIISAAPKVNPNFYKIIIIGAGPSGIAAATRLLENGENDTLILEAEGRIGGRIKSIRFGEGGYVDLGAEWCHGQEGNIVYEMMEPKGILSPDNNSVTLHYSDGTRFDKTLEADIVDFLFNKVESAASTDETKFWSEEKQALKLYDKYILEKYKNNPKNLKKAVDTIKTLEGMICSNDGSFSWKERAYYTNFNDCGGRQDLNWGGHGYFTIINHLMKDKHIPAFTSLQKEVHKIHWKKNGGMVQIMCKQGNAFYANHVIFTPSLGVLKKDHENLFSPRLPAKKVEAIQKLGFDAVIKIMMHFPKKWWPGKFGVRAIVWSSEDKANLSNMFKDGPIKPDGTSWLQYVNYILPVANHSNIISAWITGDIIPELEIQLAKDTTPIKAGLMFVLHKFFDNEFPNITKMDHILFPQWYSNKHFRGTYSYETTESIKADFNCNEELGATLYDENDKPVVFFAGEATSKTHYATVHGAIETGYRVADSLLEYLNHPSKNHNQKHK